MGWKLAEEVAWARPDRPGPEWWTLMDIAQDARDNTRRSVCGIDYLMARAKCSRATLYRRLKRLTDDRLIIVVTHSAPGRRAVYEVSDQLTTGLTIVETCTGLTIVETRTGEQVSESTGTGLKIAETGLSVSETPSVIPPSYLRQKDLAEVRTPEGGSLLAAELGAAPQQPIEHEAYQSWIARRMAANA